MVLKLKQDLTKLLWDSCPSFVERWWNLLRVMYFALIVCTVGTCRYDVPLSLPFLLVSCKIIQCEVSKVLVLVDPTCRKIGTANRFVTLGIVYCSTLVSVIHRVKSKWSVPCRRLSSEEVAVLLEYFVHNLSTTCFYRLTITNIMLEGIFNACWHMQRTLLKDLLEVEMTNVYWAT